MSGCTVTCEGRTVELSEIELARGRRNLVTRLGELRQACPSLRIVEAFELAPMMLVEMNLHGHQTQVLVDPLDVSRRLGLRPALPAWMEELSNEAGDGWLEV